jgi:predicted N-acetyltransferase YhbS
MSIHLRDAQESDRDTIRDVTLEAFADYASAPFWEEYRSYILSMLLDIQPAEQIVAEQDGRIVGAVLLYPTGATECPEIHLLAVASAARGQGIGVALVQECIRRSSQAGAPALTLFTSDIMATATRLYLRMGFVRVSEFDFQATPDVIAKFYRLPLNIPVS